MLICSVLDRSLCLQTYKCWRFDNSVKNHKLSIRYSLCKSPLVSRFIIKKVCRWQSLHTVAPYIAFMSFCKCQCTHSAFKCKIGLDLATVHLSIYSNTLLWTFSSLCTISPPVKILNIKTLCLFFTSVSHLRLKSTTLDPLMLHPKLEMGFWVKINPKRWSRSHTRARCFFLLLSDL